MGVVIEEQSLFPGAWQKYGMGVAMCAGWDGY